VVNIHYPEDFIDKNGTALRTVGAPDSTGNPEDSSNMVEDTENETSDEGSRFKIGAVSRITQIPVDTLRAWERRYQVVSPQRTGTAARLYSGDDVERLKLIKRLVGNGHAISSVANLTRTELDDLTQLHHDNQRDDGAVGSGTVANAVVFSESRESLLPADHPLWDDITVTAHCRSWPEFEAAALRKLPDALVIDVAALLRNRARQILQLHTQTAAKRTVVIYGFAPADVLADLSREGVVTLRSPADSYQLARELTRPLRSRAVPYAGLPDTVVPRILDDALLETLANAAPAVQCECPHHLVDIVRTLTQFEMYSAECENRDDEDAALHAKLRRTTSAARGIFERALIEVAEYEGIALPADLQHR
jgi:DNA-binding transcriptional MerR regulator